MRRTSLPRLAPAIPLALALALFAAAHGEHGSGAGSIYDLNMEGVDTRGYAERHMNTEHHIDEFDLESFFNLHDLNRDGFLDIPEIEAVYGLHHPHATRAVPQPELQESKRRVVTDRVLKRLDANGDGLLSLQEFLAGGMEGLPSFKSYGDLGHHYDEESEYFLHHEELYHSTPETQTDESYNHPEDIEHFAHHEHIEAAEDARERAFEGIKANAPIGEDRPITDPLNQYEEPGSPPAGDAAEGSAEKPMIPVRPPGAVGRPARIDNDQADAAERGAKIRAARKDAAGLPGYGEGDFHRPRSVGDKMRKGLPYKYKFANRNEF